MPGAIVNTLIDTDSTTLKEDIGSATFAIMQRTEPVFRDMVLGGMASGYEWAGEGGPSRVGRDMRVKRKFQPMIGSGVIRGGHQNNLLSLYGDTVKLGGAHLRQLQATRTWPDPSTQGTGQTYGFTAEIHAIETNFMLSLTQMGIDANPMSIRKEVAPVLAGFSQRLANWAQNQWHADPESQWRLASLGPSTGSSSTGTPHYVIDSVNKRVLFYPVEKTVHKFLKGDEVDIFSDATTRRNEAGGARIPLWVDVINHRSNLVVLTALSDASFATITTGTLGENSFVVAANTYDGTLGFRGLYPWRSFEKHGSYGDTNAARRILGSLAITTTADDYIDVADRQEHASGFYDISGPITEQRLLEIMDNEHGFLDVYGLEYDTVLVSQGIPLNIFAQYQSRTEFERRAPAGVPGNLMSMGLMKNGAKVQLGDRSYEFFTSRCLDAGRMLFFRRKANWAILTPPSIPGTQRGGEGLGHEELDGKIPFEFLLPPINNGNPSMLFQRVSGTAVLPTEFAMYPGWVRMQFLPIRQFSMLRLDNVTANQRWMTVDIEP